MCHLFPLAPVPRPGIGADWVDTWDNGILPDNILGQQFKMWIKYFK